MFAVLKSKMFQLPKASIKSWSGFIDLVALEICFENFSEQCSMFLGLLALMMVEHKHSTAAGQLPDISSFLSRPKLNSILELSCQITDGEIGKFRKICPGIAQSKCNLQNLITPVNHPAELGRRGWLLVFVVL